MPVILFLLLVAGCSKGGAEIVPPLPIPAAPTDDDDGWHGLAPTVTIVGYEKMSLSPNDTFAIPASGGEPGVIGIGVERLCVEVPELDTCPPTILMSGVLEPGIHDVLDIWDGASTHDTPVFHEYLHLAGDVNDDGILDVWFGNDLFLGPLLGRALRFGEGDAFSAELPYAAGFDADGDGHEDMATYAGARTAYVYHGPFEGDIPTLTGGDADPSQVTLFGSDYGGFSTEVIWLHQNHLGPGRHAIAVGAAASAGGPDTYFYELNQPRGARVPFEAAFATHQQLMQSDGVHDLLDAGDLDGDGNPDVLQENSFVFQGPLKGHYWVTGAGDPELVDTFVMNTNPMRPIGDLNGDGIQEVTAAWFVDGESTYVVVFSPYDEDVDLSLALPIMGPEELDNSHLALGKLQADLDGDGLTDLVHPVNANSAADKGRIHIWYGKDILAAWEALQASR